MFNSQGFGKMCLVFDSGNQAQYVVSSDYMRLTFWTEKEGFL